MSDQPATPERPRGFADEIGQVTAEPQPAESSIATESDPDDGWSVIALVVGIGIVAIALSGLIDNSGLLEHPFWVVPAAAFLVGCFSVAARAIQRVIGSTN